MIWFPLGVYIMFNPSISHGLQGVTISMQIKDKMCLLNGDVGGQIHSSVEITALDNEVDADSMTIEKNPVLIYNIIKQLVNHWGNENLNKIIISQVPLKIKMAIKWNGNVDVYIVYKEGQKNNYSLKIGEQITKQYIKDRTIKPGQDVGFIYTDFVYPEEKLGSFTVNIGETVTSALDKIISIIGNYEYFYDVFGNFVFREKQNYLNMSNTAYWSKETDDQMKTINLPADTYEANYLKLTKPVYNFTGNNYVISYNNTLNFNNIKNDFVVWGTRKTLNGDGIPCRFHLAIDKIPSLNTHSIALYYDSNQIARGVFYNTEAGKPAIGTQLFPKAERENARGKIFTIINSRTSVDWRQEIYYQMLQDQYIGTGTNTQLNNTYFQYYAELKEEFPKLFNLETQEYRVNIKENPEEINYFLDFIDESSDLGQYSVNNIGRRSKILDSNNQGINCVFEPQIPDLVYINTSKYPKYQDLNTLREQLTHYGQKWTQIDDSYDALCSTGGIYNSCFEKIKDLLYQYTHVNNTISITGLPIYYLQPNTRITVDDTASGIEGDYIIQSISLPLDISSTMNINAYKALQKI